MRSSSPEEGAGAGRKVKVSQTIPVIDLPLSAQSPLLPLPVVTKVGSLGSCSVHGFSSLFMMDPFRDRMEGTDLGLFLPELLLVPLSLYDRDLHVRGCWLYLYSLASGLDSRAFVEAPFLLRSGEQNGIT